MISRHLSAKVSRYKWEPYRDTNWWCIYYFLAAYPKFSNHSIAATHLVGAFGQKMGNSRAPQNGAFFGLFFTTFCAGTANQTHFPPPPVFALKLLACTRNVVFPFFSPLFPQGHFLQGQMLSNTSKLFSILTVPQF